MKSHLAITAALAGCIAVAACSTARTTPDAAPAEAPAAAPVAATVPDISGLAWMGGDRFLAVHDAKDPAGGARVSVLALPTSAVGMSHQPVELAWPDPQGPSSDLESVARVPGTSSYLLAESGSGRRGGVPLRRIFLVELREGRFDLVDVVDWPVPVTNVEGAAVARVGEQLVFVFAERAEGEPATLLRSAPLTLRPFAFGSFTAVTFAVPEPTGRYARPISAIDIDQRGQIYVASAVDPGTDDGPFRSIIWRIGRIGVDASGAPKITLDARPQRLATLDGLKVEGIALRETGTDAPEIIFGTDDEGFGGIIRRVPSVIE
jgi:hypothetical protein